MSLEVFDFSKEAKYSAIYFIKYIKQTHNIDLANVDIAQFVDFYQKKRTFHTTQDTFIHICRFLEMPDILSFTTICREYMEYYPLVWDIIHRQHFPASIARELTHVDIRNAVSLEEYYHGLVDHGMKDDDWVRINNAEVQMKNYSDLMVAAIKNPTGDVNATNYFTEYKKYVNERDSVFNWTSCTMKAFLETYKFNSMADICKIKYYTIKPELNCEVYGLDHEKDKNMVRNKRRWMTGQYTTRVEFNYDESEVDEDFSDITYGADPISGERFRYRTRPEYC